MGRTSKHQRSQKQHAKLRQQPEAEEAEPTERKLHLGEKRMEPEGSRPVLINQIALEQAIPEEERETFRENQRRRGFRLVTDLILEEAQRQREESPVLPETQPDPENQEKRESISAREEREARDLIEQVKTADPNSEEFLGRPNRALLWTYFGRRQIAGE